MVNGQRDGASREGGPQHEAPGELERVRALLNTWFVANDSRLPVDRFEEESRSANVPAAQADTLRQLRDDLRVVVEGGPTATDLLDRWIERLAVRPSVRAGGLVFIHDGTAAGAVLVAVLDAVVDQRWSRLKACPDCRWVFYDHTRNASKRWCLMYAGGPTGRACGTIAKVRRHRSRRAREGSVPDTSAEIDDE